jgi:hypothetical protein
MKINYIKEEDSIEIKDDLKNNYFFMKFLVGLNILNAALRLINIKETGFGFQEIVWLIVGVVSLIVLYFFLFKRSTSDKIALSEIKRLKVKSVFGRKRYSLELTNGKQRNLIRLKDENELSELKKFLNNCGAKA